MKRQVRGLLGRVRHWKAVLPACLSLIIVSCGVIGQLSPSSPNSISSTNYSSTGYGNPSGPTISASPNSASWKLVWQDNFEGTGFPANWVADTGGYGFGDKQLQWNSADNAKLSGHGGLIITANKNGSDYSCWYGPCQYTAAEIQTTFAQTYGLFEARIKLPSGTGLWPAFWMIPAATANDPQAPGEIDIIEVNNREPYLVTGYVHDGSVFNYKAKKVLNIPSSDGYHIYGVDWTPTGITWTFDGVPFGHISAYKNWPFDQPFIILLTLAVGGSWPGPPTASTKFPAQMLVSWVRIYREATYN